MKTAPEAPNPARKIRPAGLWVGSLLGVLLWTACADDESGETPTDATVSRAESMASITRTAVQTTAVGVGSLFEARIPDEIAKTAFLQHYIDPIRFFDDDSGYFFVETLDAVMVAHPIQPDLVGQERIDVQDAEGNYYVREMVDLLETAGEGFVDYYFENPTTGEPGLKNSYVKRIEFSDTFIGAGYYVPDDSERVDAAKSDLDNCRWAVHGAAAGFGGVLAAGDVAAADLIPFLRTFIEKIRFFPDGTGYFFVYRTDGTLVAHPIQADIVDTNRIDHEDSQGKRYVREMCDLIEDVGSGVVDYHKVNFQTGAEELKRSYVERIPGTDLFFGAGVYIP